MDCATLCLLTAAIKFVPGPDTMNCTYCVDARSTYPDCFDNVMECAYRDPSSLIICMNVFENTGTLVHQSVRCVSYEQFYISDDDIRFLGESGMCKYHQVKSCECQECPAKIPSTTTPEPDSDEQLARRVHSRKHHKHHGSHSYDHHHNGLNSSAPRQLTSSQLSAYKEEGLFLTSASTQQFVHSLIACSLASLLLRRI